MPRIVLKDLETEKPLAVADLEATLGRDPACGFFIEGPKSKVVSGRHARIFFQDDTWWIEDTSRNGTVLDNERLQAGQRHAIRVGQVIGLGESGPRLRVAVLESRKVAETLMELSDVDAPPPPPKLKTTAPRQPAVTSHKPAAAEVSESTMAMRRSEAQRAGVRIEEPTEPMSPAPDWLVQVVLVATNTNKRYDVTSMVVKLGRSPECNVQIPPELGASVSRLHAEVAIQDGGVVVRDAGSRNGTFVNGKRLDAPHPAAKNDLIMLGSGGPTFSIEDLHIVKGPTSPSEPSGGGGRGEATPVEPKPAKGSAKPLVEPRTDPTPLAKAKGALKADVLEDMSQIGAKRVRVIVWASVIATVAIAVVLLAVAQGRVNESEQRIVAQGGQFEAARGTGVEQSLLRARESLSEQLASADSAGRQAEQETVRLRAELGKASGSEGSGARLDSLRRALKAAEDRATAVATQVRAVRASNLAQVAQLNQGAVGLLVSFSGERVVSGSGFVITPSGYFVTNRRVVVDDSGKVRDTIYVTMADQRFTLANRIQVVALGSRELDIAVVKIPDYRGPHMKKVDWRAAGANQGEPAALIGFPYGVELAFDDTSSNVVRTSLSAGIFSKVAPDRIDFDAFTVGGSSGSPVLNAAGEVVAVHRAGLGTGPGLGLSIPISRIVSLLPADARNELGIR